MLKKEIRTVVAWSEGEDRELTGIREGTFWADGNVPCLDLGGAYTKEIHQNLYTAIKTNSWGIRVAEWDVNGINFISTV